MWGVPRALLPLIATVTGVPFVLAAQAQVPADAELQQADGFIRDGRFIDAEAAYRHILNTPSSTDTVRERAEAGLTLSLLSAHGWMRAPLTWRSTGIRCGPRACSMRPSARIRPPSRAIQGSRADTTAARDR